MVAEKILKSVLQVSYDIEKLMINSCLLPKTSNRGYRSKNFHPAN